MQFYEHISLPNTEAYYKAYICDKSPEYQYNDKRAAVVLCPGGGYEMTSDREDEPMALKYFAAGFNVFVVKYSTGRLSSWPAPQCDVMKAIFDIRKNADKYNILENKIALGGFSAGGHLAASIGVHWNNVDLCRNAGVLPENIKPDALVLYYPVIKADYPTHEGTIENLLQGHVDREKIKELLSLEKHVDKDTPPTFIVHTFDDDVVPVVGSLEFAEALYKNGVMCEIHISESGPHGLATGDRITNQIIYSSAVSWTENAIIWLKNKFGFLN